jgi:mRNA interferase MazF
VSGGTSGRTPAQLPVVRRGEVYDARLYPGTEGSEQAGIRPVISVSRDAINRTSSVVLGVPCTTFRPGRTIFPSQTLLRAPDGGLSADSLALGEQVRPLATTRLLRRRGAPSESALAHVERVLLIALDIPVPTGAR